MCVRLRECCCFLYVGNANREITKLAAVYAFSSHFMREEYTSLSNHSETEMYFFPCVIDCANRNSV